MRYLWVLVVLLSLGVPGWSQGLDYASLDWLRGDWVGDHDGAVLEESWSPARGQSMLGFSRMVADGKTVHREFLSLEGTDLRLHLPQADGTMRSLSMQLLEQTPSSFTFIDAGHKEKLEYRSVDAQHLQITLTKGEKTVFRLHRPGLTGANVLGRLFGAYTLTTQIGSRTFADLLQWKHSPDDDLSGTLSVPGGFTASLEHIQIEGLKVTFEIEANEKSGKFRVHYTLLFDDAEDRCVGFLRHPDGKLMGTFTGMRSSK